MCPSKKPTVVSGHVISHHDMDGSDAASSIIKHGLCVSAYLLLIYLNVVLIVDSADNTTVLYPSQTYGLLGSALLYILRFLPLLPLLFCIFNFLGIVCINTFPPKPKLQYSPLVCSFVCFRVVTRGQYRTLILDNVEKNIGTCRRVGLKNFVFEVVTDQALNLPSMERVREVVVPPDFRPKNGSLFKARALQYCLEPGVDTLGDEDWIVHLDEETLLTEDAVVGIVNFISTGSRHQFGQGVVTYSKVRIVNWLTTLAESVRVGFDLGVIRFTLKVLHKPVFGWKGSFVVAKAAAERSISFDHGPEASVAEDCFFAMVAFARGFSFDFVEGEMLEQSAFTIPDYIRQRQRWAQGIFLTACSSKIPLPHRLGPILMSATALTSPFTALNVPLAVVCPVPVWPAVNAAFAFISSTLLFLFILGTVKSFSPKRYGLWRCGLLVLVTVLTSVVILLLEMVAILFAILTPYKKEFFVVQKERPAETDHV